MSPGYQAMRIQLQPRETSAGASRGNLYSGATISKGSGKCRPRVASSTVVMRGSEPVVCALCDADLACSHRHLFGKASRKMICACDGCALPYHTIVAGHFKLVPQAVRVLPEVYLSPRLQEQLGQGVTLFVWDSYENRPGLLRARFTGVSLMFPRDDVTSELGQLPALHALEPDVEALLMHHGRGVNECCAVPLDMAYQLVWSIAGRQSASGLSEAVWRTVRRSCHSSGRNESTCGVSPDDLGGAVIVRRALVHSRFSEVQE